MVFTDVNRDAELAEQSGCRGDRTWIDSYYLPGYLWDLHELGFDSVQVESS